MAGGLVQSSVGKTGYGPQVGAAAGAVAGAVIGSVVPVIGTIIGGLIGGVVGGSGGGFIGPNAPSQFSYVNLNAARGRLGILGAPSQGIDNTQQVADAQKSVVALNDFFTQQGIRVGDVAAAPVGYGQYAQGGGVGDYFKFLRFTADQGIQQDQQTALNNVLRDRSFDTADELQKSVVSVNDFIKGTLEPLKQYASASDVRIDDYSSFLGRDNNFGAFRFGSNAGGDLGSAINTVAGGGRSFGSIQELQTVVEDARAFVLQTMPALVQSGEDLLTQSTATQKGVFEQYQTQIDGVTAQYQAAIEKARTLNVTETGLADARDKAVEALGKQRNAAEAAAIGQVNLGRDAIDIRYYAALGQVNRDSSLTKFAALRTFDNQAQQQRDALSAQLVSVYGDSIKTTAGYAGDLAILERTLGEEPLAIAKQYDDQLTGSAQEQARARDSAQQNATAVITNIADYARSLQYGSTSALSPQDQLAIARNQFNASAAGANAGNVASLQSITGDAQTFLAASRDVYGSGAGYAEAFGRATDALSSISTLTIEPLTQSFMDAAPRNQTATLQTELQTLQGLVRQLLDQQKLTSMTPVRLVS